MKILVINAGSSSLKYQIIDMDNEQMLCKGNCERIGLEMGLFSYKKADGYSVSKEIPMKNHSVAFQQVMDAVSDPEHGAVKDLSEISAVGHRVVQGGAIFHKSELVNDEVIAGIESLIPLAPLHNSANVQGVKACIEVLGKDVPQVVVFDTSFHATMPLRLTCMLFLTSTMRSITSEDTVLTAHLTDMLLTVLLRLWARTLRILKSFLATSVTVLPSQLLTAVLLSTQLWVSLRLTVS